MKIIFLGPPGSGKGTYSTRISTQLNVPHISTGDLFREEAKRGTELGITLLGYMKKGVLVPDELTTKILKERISKPDCKNGYILDGYPRNIPQAEELDKISKIDVVINLNVPDNILIKKLTARRVCKNCGEIYNIADIHEVVNGVEYSMPPMLPKNDMKCDKYDMKCDKCGGDLIQRPDDKEDIQRERLNVYKKETIPLIDYYKKKGLIKDVFVISGPEIMVPKIMEILKSVKV